MNENRLNFPEIQDAHLDQMTVSYTHLDVYKRQPYSNAKMGLYALQKR